MVFFQKNPVFFDWTSNIYEDFWVNKYIVPFFYGFEGGFMDNKKGVKPIRSSAGRSGQTIE